MRDDIYIESVVVLQIHWYLKSYWGGWPPSRANLDWTDIANRAWTKAFEPNPQWLTWQRHPPELEETLARRTSTLDATIQIYALFMVTVRGRPELLGAEVERLKQNFQRFLAMPAGRVHKAEIDENPLP